MSKEERPIEDYRAAVIALKKQYKKLADDYQELQTDYSRNERKIKQFDIFDTVKVAQKINKNVTKMQSVIRGGFWRRKIKSIREKVQNTSKGLSQQEKYLKYVSDDTYQLEHALIQTNKILKENYGVIFILIFDYKLNEKVNSLIIKHFIILTGLNLTMLFRILDKKGQSSILTEDFTNFLTKYVELTKKAENEMRITPELIKTLVSAFDKNECGYISSEKYISCIQKYGLDENKSGQIYQKTELHIHLEKALQKVIAQCEFKGISPEQLFRQLATNNPQYMAKDVFINWVQSGVEMEKLTKNELIALNVIFNLDQTYFIKKMDYLSKILPVKRNVSKQTSGKNSLQNSRVSLSNLNVFSRISSTQIKNSPEGSQEFSKDDQVQAIIQKMFSKKPLHLFLESILLTLNSEKTYLTTEDLSYHLDQYLGEQQVSYKEKGIVFRSIDQDGNGNLEMDELVTFFVSMSKRVQVSLQTFIIMQAKLLEIEGQDTNSYFQEIGIDTNVQEEIDLKTFHSTIGQNIGLDEDNINNLFLEFDKNRVGKVSVKELISTIDSYRSDKGTLINQNQQDNLVQKKIKMLDDLKIQLEIKANLTVQKLWTKVDSENKGYVSLYELKTAITKALPDMNPFHIIDLLQMIDINDNSIVDKQEFELAFLNSAQDLLKARKSQKNTNSQSNFSSDDRVEDKAEVIKIFKNSLIQHNLTPIKFFEQADTDRSGDISLVELKIQLAHQQLDLSILLKLMKIFDKNVDGVICYEEFIQEIGESLEENLPAQNIKTLISVKKEVLQDDRADLEIRSKLNQYGEEKPHELKEAILSLGKFLLDRSQQHGNNKVKAYEELFQEFDVNTDMFLTRAEFIQGLDKYNEQLKLNDRQKIRLMLSADINKDDKIDMNEFIQFLTDSVYKIESNDSQSEKDQRIHNFKSKIKENGGFFVDEKQDYELVINKMKGFLSKELLELLEKKQLENEDEQMIDKISLENKVEKMIKIANQERNEDEQLSVNNLRQIFIFNTFQFQLSVDEVDTLMQAFSDEFKGKVIQLNIPKRIQSKPPSRQVSQMILKEQDDEN